jgi:thiosulfate/3-mercaptopyruvate sulfurtransferase
MKSLLPILLLTFISCTVTSKPSPAGNNNEKLIVSTGWLSKHLSDQNLVILFVGKREDYDKEHIPGAQFVIREKLSTPYGEGLTLEMPSFGQLKDAFEELGISNDSKIIIYFIDWITFATRVYFTLDYIGLGDRAFLLDGGLDKWKNERFQVTNEIPEIKKGTIKINPNEDIVAEINWVAENLNNLSVSIVDARNREYYKGENTGNYKRPGHIANAVSFPYSETISEKTPYVLKDKETLKKLFSKAGVGGEKTIVSYCHVGQQATLIYFVAKYLGYKAKMYDGSYQEWDERNDLPYEGPKNQ